jgi:hypothetical protein
MERLAVEMQKIGVKTRRTPRAPSVAAWVSGEVRKAIITDAAQFAVRIGGLRAHGRERRKRAWIVCSVSDLRT